MELSIIIVNWNSKDYLRACIDSIQAETRDLEFEIIVIDSASFDGCGEMLREHYPQVRFIQSDENLGFAKANNAAFETSKGEVVLFLNPDTELLGPAINTLYDNLQRLPDAGSVGCKLLNTDRSIQTSCIQSLPSVPNQILDSELLRARWPRSRLWGMAPLFKTNRLEPCEVEAISGACVMLKRERFELVGRFSEDYFMYGEDMDLAYKIRNCGYKNYYVPVATVIHHGGSSSQHAASEFSVVMMRESIWRFLRKTRGAPYALAYRVAMLASSLVRLPFVEVATMLKVIPGRKKLRSSRRKWRAILRWSVHHKDSVRRFEPSEIRAAASARHAAESKDPLSFAASHRGDS